MCQSKDPFVCFGAKPTQRACARDLPRDRKKTREKRRNQTTEERMIQCSWWLCGNFARIHTRASPQIHRKLRKSVTIFSLLVLRANPNPCLFILFSSTLSGVYVVFCVSVKKCEIPWPEMRKTTRRSNGHEWFGRLS